MQDDQPKKRGRKPKNKMQDIEETSDSDIFGTKKKRGRKPTGKIIDINKVCSINNDFSSCIIAHLPLSIKDVEKITNEEKIEKSSVLPIINLDINDESSHYDRDGKCKQCITLDNICKDLKNRIKELEEDNPAISDNNKHQYICNIKLVDITNGQIEWKAKTETCCWWCCHQFDTTPIGLPEKYYDETFYVQGCFCSFNCAHAYNLDLNDHRVWERYSLLNYLKMKITSDDKAKSIIPAPPRQGLRMFGGPLTIEEYRNKFQRINLEFYYMLPPMIPVIGVLEEIPKELVPANIKMNSQNLKLKRSKPLPSFNSNLLQLMKKT